MVIQNPILRFANIAPLLKCHVVWERNLVLFTPGFERCNYYCFTHGMNGLVYLAKIRKKEKVTFILRRKKPVENSFIPCRKVEKGERFMNVFVAYLIENHYICITINAVVAALLRMEKLDEDIIEKAFVVRSYGKGELACMYIHGVQQQTAVKQFNEWIRTAPGLEQRLLATGLSHTARRYTPAQVRLIVNVFGAP